MHRERATIIASTSPLRQHGVALILGRDPLVFHGGDEDEGQESADIAANKAIFAFRRSRFLSPQLGRQIRYSLGADATIETNAGGIAKSKIDTTEALADRQHMVDRAKETNTPPYYVVIAGAARAEGRRRKGMEVNKTTRTAKVILNTDALSNITTTEGWEMYRAAVAATDILPNGEGSTPLENIAQQLSLPALTKLKIVDAIELEGTSIPRYLHDGSLNPAFVRAFKTTYWMQGVSIPPGLVDTNLKRLTYINDPWMEEVTERVFGSELVSAGIHPASFQRSTASHIMLN